MKHCWAIIIILRVRNFGEGPFPVCVWWAASSMLNCENNILHFEALWQGRRSYKSGHGLTTFYIIGLVSQLWDTKLFTALIHNIIKVYALYFLKTSHSFHYMDLKNILPNDTDFNYPANTSTGGIMGHLSIILWDTTTLLYRESLWSVLVDDLL